MEEYLINYMTHTLYLPDWTIDAILDSIKTVPFLFIVFLFIEIFEHFFSNKIQKFLSHSEKSGPIIGSIVSSIPQCGFSVVASSLYTKGFISKGTIISSFLATSDEAIPVLLLYPALAPLILPLIVIKLLFAIPIGYLTDFLIRKKEKEDKKDTQTEIIEGCCCHEISGNTYKKRNLIVHPIKHTLNIFIFMLFVTIVLNLLIEKTNLVYLLNNKNMFSCFAPLISSIIGLIPNCAISVGLVVLFTKGMITFGTMTAGLMSGAGLGLLVLIRKNKSSFDTFLIILVLVVSGFLSGLLINYCIQTNFLASIFP